MQKPWITKGILKPIKNKPKLCISHFIKGNYNAKQYYKKVRKFTHENQRVL